MTDNPENRENRQSSVFGSLFLARTVARPSSQATRSDVGACEDGQLSVLADSETTQPLL